MLRPFFLFALLPLLGHAPAATAGRAAVASPSLAHPTDTIVVRLPNQAVLTVTVRDAAQLRELKNYHLDSLTSRLASYIGQAEAAAQTGTAKSVTMDFYPAKDRPGQNLPEQVRITARKPAAPGSKTGSNKVEVFLEKKMGLVVDVDGEDITIGKPGVSKADRQAHRDSVRLKNMEKNHDNINLILDVGLNAFAGQKQYYTAGGQPETVSLRPEGSRYVNIGFDANIRLGGKHSPVYLIVGPEFAFNNYMLNGNDKWVSANGRTDVVRETNGRQYQKTKLATSSVNLPLMLQIKLRDAHYKPTLTLGVGGFVGYHLKAWTKLKYTEEGSTYKDKDYSDYHLEPLLYGLQGTIGYRGLELFAKYNMNRLFKAGMGPDTQVLSFGVRLFGN